MALVAEDPGMEWADRFTGLVCRSCAAHTAPSEPAVRCPDCGGSLTVEFDHSDMEWPGTVPRDIWAFASGLPIEAPHGGLRPGGTPLVETPQFADAVDIERVLIKDESRNPTGSVWDRDMAIAGAAAAQLDVEHAALPAPGAAGQAAAAVGARYGIDTTVFVPARSTFLAKAGINVSGATMRVIPGRYADARSAFHDEHDSSWYSLEPGVNPFLQAGRWTLAWELVAGFGSQPPEMVVVPTGTGDGLVAMIEAFTMAEISGRIDAMPRIVAAQPETCAPIVEAMASNVASIEPVSTPDTICGELEVPEPPAGQEALAKLREIDGTAVAVSDAELYAAAIKLAREDGLIPSLAGGIAAAALVELDGIDATEAVIINPGSGLVAADRLRSYLMGLGE